MKRVLIIGSGGSGKSTLSRQLSKKKKLPVIHLDQHFWKPNWIECTKEEWEAKVKELIKADQWIMDGNYGGTMELRFPRADTIIFLNLSRWICFRRVLGRWWKYRNQSRPDMPPNCPERISFEFLHYIFVYPITRRPKILKRLEEIRNNHNIYIFRSPKEVQHFIASI